jgi:colicin import membrane protein
MKKLFKSRAFLYALLLHLAIIFLVFFSVHFSSTPMSAASAPSENPTKIVEAVAVNQTQVQQEVQKIQQERAAKAQQAVEQERQLQQQQAALKQQQQVAAKAKAALAAQQTALKQQQAALAKAQQQQADKAAALQAQQQAVAKAAAVAKAQQQSQQQAAQQALQQKLQQDQADTQAAAQAAQATAQAKQQAAQMAGTVNKYNALILAAIHPNWIISDKQKDLSTDVLISLAPDGSVLSVQVQKSSGSTAFDNSAVAAVYKSSPLPVPSDPQAFAVFRQFKLTLHPEG